MRDILNTLLLVTGDDSAEGLLIPRAVAYAETNQDIKPDGTTRYDSLDAPAEDQELHPDSIAIRSTLASGDAGAYIAFSVRLTPTGPWVVQWVHRESDTWEAALALGYLLARAVTEVQTLVPDYGPTSDQRHEILLHPAISAIERAEWLGRLEHTPPAQRDQLMASFREAFPPREKHRDQE